ncbi:unnamed protein product [Didymodactylos carnosus]|nr:unnamed protein product [Didymodactylos carnosus]CAF4187528.1 unnamed protein product [Didymodactylos carnosus]
MCINGTTSTIISSSRPVNPSHVCHNKISHLKSYCDLIPNPNHNWVSAKRYKESDLMFIIVSGAKFYHTRAMTVRDTWLSRVTNYYILSSTPYSYLPVTVIPNTGEDYLSNMKKTFYGMPVIYKEQLAKPVEMRQKWFYLIGDDTYVNVRHLIKRLDPYDYQQAYFVGGSSGKEVCYEVDGTRNPITFGGGGAGLLFSWKLFELLQPNLTDYVDNKWVKTNAMSDVAIACLIQRVGYQLTYVNGFWPLTPARMVQLSGRAAMNQDPEPNNFHYVQPPEMIDLDEFYSFQYIDRLANDQNLQELTEFTRLFVKKYYELVRKKQKECTLPPITS